MPTLVLQDVTIINTDTVFDYTSAQAETFLIHTNGARVSAARDFGNGRLHTPTVFGRTAKELEFSPLSPAGAKWRIEVEPHPKYRAGEPEDGQAYIIIESMAA